MKEQGSSSLPIETSKAQQSDKQEFGLTNLKPYRYVKNAFGRIHQHLLKKEDAANRAANEKLRKVTQELKKELFQSTTTSKNK